MRPHDGRALSDKELERIQKTFYEGTLDDADAARLFETILVLRQVTRELLSRYHREPMRRVSTADPIPNSALDHLRERASLDDARPHRPQW